MRFEITGFLPQRTRKRLFQLVYDVYRARASDPERRSGKGKPAVNKAMAEDLGVSVETIKAWKADKFQGADRNAFKLLEKALELRPRETLEILREDLEMHRALVEEIEAEYSSEEAEIKREKEAKKKGIVSILKLLKGE
ncbi:hypothetical protein DRN86_04990 [Candidatus Geothermarchaeota archaeon]|nr:MAG: hypothetical protein DRN86_04990 [Candidatus Geothermarchaeota archaeon]